MEKEGLPEGQLRWHMAAILAAPLIAKRKTIKTGDPQEEREEIARIIRRMVLLLDEMDSSRI